MFSWILKSYGRKITGVKMLRKVFFFKCLETMCWNFVLKMIFRVANQQVVSMFHIKLKAWFPLCKIVYFISNISLQCNIMGLRVCQVSKNLLIHQSNQFILKMKCNYLGFETMVDVYFCLWVNFWDGNYKHSILTMFNPIPLDKLRFRAKTLPQIKGKRQYLVSR